MTRPVLRCKVRSCQPFVLWDEAEFQATSPQSLTAPVKVRVAVPRVNRRHRLILPALPPRDIRRGMRPVSRRSCIGHDRRDTRLRRAAGHRRATSTMMNWQSLHMEGRLPVHRCNANCRVHLDDATLGTPAEWASLAIERKLRFPVFEGCSRRSPAPCASAAPPDADVDRRLTRGQDQMIFGTAIVNEAARSVGSPAEYNSLYPARGSSPCLANKRGLSRQPRVTIATARRPSEPYVGRNGRDE